VPRFTTELYVKGELRNEKDGVLSGIRDPRSRQLLMVDYQPIPNSRTVCWPGSLTS
jgi:hypothetical protein